MKHTSLTLLSLAALAPAAFALDVKDDDLKLGLSLVLQARVENGSGTNSAGNDYNVAEAANMGSDTLDFYVRRARLGFKGSYKNDYKFAMIVRADSADKSANASDRSTVLYEATVGRQWKMDNGFTHAVTTGVFAPAFNTAANVHSSSSFLLLNESATGALIAPRGGGAQYSLTAPWVSAWIDIQNVGKGLVGDADNSDAGYDNADASKGEGLWKSARVHISPEGEWKIDKPAESFAGKPGHGILLGVDFAKNDDDRDGTHTYSTTAWGIDLVFHYDGLSALAEYRTAKTEDENPAVDAVTAKAWRIQAGYAFPMGDTFVEPAIRYSKLDLNTDNDEEGTSFGNKDYGTSGSTVEVGVNWLINGHANKFGLAYLKWTGEEGVAPNDTKPDASIVRAQWQLTF